MWPHQRGATVALKGQWRAQEHMAWKKQDLLSAASPFVQRWLVRKFVPGDMTASRRTEVSVLALGCDHRTCPLTPHPPPKTFGFLALKSWTVCRLWRKKGGSFRKDSPTPATAVPLIPNQFIQSAVAWVRQPWTNGFSHVTAGLAPHAILSSWHPKIRKRSLSAYLNLTPYLLSLL